MSGSEIMDLMHEFFILAVKLSAPVLLISMAVGIVISIFQAATQIHEQTLTFVPKLLIIAVILVVMGGNMLVMLQDFFTRVLSLM